MVTGSLYPASPLPAAALIGPPPPGGTFDCGDAIWMQCVAVVCRHNLPCYLIATDHPHRGQSLAGLKNVESESESYSEKKRRSNFTEFEERAGGPDGMCHSKPAMLPDFAATENINIVPCTGSC